MLVPGDNSCLFHAVAFLTRCSDAATPVEPGRLRCLVAARMRQERERWNDVTLTESRTVQDYVAWINHPHSWGVDGRTDIQSSTTLKEKPPLVAPINRIQIVLRLWALLRLFTFISRKCTSSLGVAELITTLGQYITASINA